MLLFRDSVVKAPRLHLDNAVDNKYGAKMARSVIRFCPRFPVAAQCAVARSLTRLRPNPAPVTNEGVLALQKRAHAGLRAD
jgi:hypothetical protein